MLYYVSVEFHKDFIAVNGNQIIIGIKSRPVNGAANKEIVKKLAKHFGVSTANVSIKSGSRTKTKTIQIC